MLQKTKTYRNRKHLDFLKMLPCVNCGAGPCDPAHIRFASNAGLGRKPNDDRALSLCRPCHTEQHTIGENRFWGERIGKAIELANALAVKTSDTDYANMLILRFRMKS